MATFSIHTYPNNPVKGPQFTKKADSEVLMGALVQKGSASGDVKETDAVDNDIYGIAIVDEAYAANNPDSSGIPRERYEDNDPVVVESLISGQIYNLLNSGTAAISEGAEVGAAAHGKVVADTTDPCGIAIDGISGSVRGPVLWRVVRNDS